jgi:hypothetical protein
MKRQWTEAERLTFDQKNILGRAVYNGKTYYLVGKGTGQYGPWVKLLSAVANPQTAKRPVAREGNQFASQIMLASDP